MADVGSARTPQRFGSCRTRWYPAQEATPSDPRRYPRDLSVSIPAHDSPASAESEGLGVSRAQKSGWVDPIRNCRGATQKRESLHAVGPGSVGSYRSCPWVAPKSGPTVRWLSSAMRTTSSWGFSTRPTHNQTSEVERQGFSQATGGWAIAASRTRLWLASKRGCLSRRLSRA